ncbi:MAG: erythromycin biosynthesis sensory transduction protein eryC1 [Deltaproteobacteria bacterium]|nr:MAG: erythromycin biosynthesis sensory transduction protein eryC1 [Deltaproteobacteria bacterium]
MRDPLIVVKRLRARIEEELFEGWWRVLEDMQLLGGRNVKAFEEEIASYLGARYAFGVASGSDALLLALLACGVGEGDEVILHANAFVAAVEAIKWTGAKPVLVDMKEEDFGPDPGQVEERITERTKALLIVHMYGHPVTMEPIMELKEKYGIKLIEDCSHAHGAEYRGRKVGTFGDVGCFSCGVVKNLGAFGDAGFCVTDHPEVAERIDLLRVHGQKVKNRHLFYGFNSRLDELQAVVLRIRLRSLDEENRRRREIARFYSEAFSFMEEVLPPPDFDDRLSVYHRYVVRAKDRDRLISFLAEKGVGTGIHYPQPLHLQEAWEREGFERYHLPISERVSSQILSLPIYPELTDGEAEYVAEKVKEFYRGGP